MRTSYNTQKDEWTIVELIDIVTEDEEILKKAKFQSVQFVASAYGTKDVKRNYHKRKYHYDEKKGGKEMQHMDPKKKWELQVLHEVWT
jgi:hypothetical protein